MKHSVAGEASNTALLLSQGSFSNKLSLSMSSPPPLQSLPALMYAVFITSAFCYFFLTWSNKYMPSSVMTAFWPVQVQNLLFSTCNIRWNPLI